MFEARVLSLLRQYLGEYVSNIPDEALKISVWNGDVVLKDLKLKAEALNALKLPITVKAGFLGSVTLKVPWSRLGKDPVIVLLDRIFILAEPATAESLLQGNENEEQKKIAKRKKIEEMELQLLEAKANKSTHPSTETSSWLGSLIATVIGNLKISITNVHIRYEDKTSNPLHEFCIGLTLSKLAAFTVDDNGIETFATSSALDRVRKAVHLEKFSIYHDSNKTCWKLDKKWDDLTSSEWSEVISHNLHSHNPNPNPNSNTNPDFNTNPNPKPYPYPYPNPNPYLNPNSNLNPNPNPNPITRPL